MKRKLCLLASLSLTTSLSSTIVACGINDKNNYEDSENDITNLINELITESNTIIASFFNSVEVRNSMYSYADDESKAFEFYNKGNVEIYGTLADDNSQTNEKITSEIKDRIFGDFQYIVNTEVLNENLKVLIKKDKYSSILYDSNIIDEFTYLPESINLIYTTDNYNDSGDSSWFISSTDLTLQIKLQYKNHRGLKQNHNVNIPLIFTYANDTFLIKTIQGLQTNIGNDYLTEIEDDSYIWLDSSQKALCYEDKTNSYKMFDLYDNKIRTTALEKIYNQNTFKKIVKTFIKDKYFTDGGNLLDNIEIINKTSTTTKYTYEMTNNIKVNPSLENFNLTQNSDENYKSMSDAILVNLTETGESVDFKDYGTKNVNNAIYNLLDGNVATMVDTYQTDFNSFLETSGYTETPKSSFMYGGVWISDFWIKINARFDLKIYDFALPYSIAIDSEETISSSESTNILSSTSLGNAIYYNTVAGTLSFQNIFDTRTPTVTNAASNKLVPFAFVGQARGSENTVVGNIWDYIQSTKESYTDPINKALSLTHADSVVSRFRDLLLRNGYQNNFIFGITNYYFETNTINLPEKIEDLYPGIYSQLEKTDEGLIQADLTTNYNTRYTSLKIEFNFFRMIFAYKEFGTNFYRNEIFIQKI